MKIDIHTHTKKCKSGDPATREITAERFCEVILSTEVGIIAITNHNVFDLEQYSKIEICLENEEVQVWPGIELDIIVDGARGHLLVIVSPKLAKDFSSKVDEFTKGFSPNNFTATIYQVLERFDSLKPLYVAHYDQKKPNLSDDALEKLMSGTKNPSCVIKEVTNSISAGIYISHGHASIYGSDVHDWAKYEKLSRELPDLRLPVESFEHFCLLLEKDPTTINTVLDKKTAEDFELFPFDDGTNLKMKVFNDINIIFGSKGTGKSCILEAIAKYYTENGVDAKVYKPVEGLLDKIYDTKGKDLKINLENYEIDVCIDEIEALRIATEIDITSLAKYATYFEKRRASKNSQKIRLKEFETEDENGVKREFLGFKQALDKTGAFLEFLEEDASIKKELNKEDHEQLTLMLRKLLERLRGQKWNTFSGWKEIFFLNSAIEAFSREVERKTGSPAKPTTTGFREYAMNRMHIEINAAKIVKNVNTMIPMNKKTVGNLGANKGLLEFCTEFKFQSGNIVDSSLLSLIRVKKETQKKFIKCVKKIQTNTYRDSLFQYISEFNEIEDVEGIKSVVGLLCFKRYFALNEVPYSPSSGETSMVMLQKELGIDKDVYILDEPEKSLGNEYINDVIVPLIKERARAGKKVFISTHDANIAVRTLPYNSIYRCHEQTGYKTYTGNPFSNNLFNLQNNDDRLDWKKISMKTLEGGEEAFGERGKIYGND